MHALFGESIFIGLLGISSASPTQDLNQWRHYNETAALAARPGFIFVRHTKLSCIWTEWRDLRYELVALEMAIVVNGTLTWIRIMVYGVQLAFLNPSIEYINPYHLYTVVFTPYAHIFHFFS